MFHAKSDRSRVHDLETAGDDFLVADVVKTGRFRILGRVSRINTVDLHLQKKILILDLIENHPEY